MSLMKKYSILLLFFLFLCSCHETTSDSPSSLLLYPGLDWNAEIDEVERLFPGGEVRTHDNMEIEQYLVSGVELWDDAVSLMFEFQDGHIRVLRCMYEDEEIDAEVIREKLRTAYGAPWKEFAWQEGRNEWRSEERMIDRLDEKTAQEIRVELEALTAIPNMNRFDSLYRLYEELCERYLVTLSFYEEEKTLEWNPYRYTMVAKYSEEKTSGKVPFAELLALSEGGQEMMAEDGLLQEIRISCDEKGLEEYKKKLGPSSERFLAFDMPEGSIFWVSEEQVYNSYEKATEREYYSRVAVYQDFSDEPYWMSAKMYRTPLVMLYWDRDTEELVWDLTGQANLERVRTALG